MKTTLETFLRNSLSESINFKAFLAMCTLYEGKK